MNFKDKYFKYKKKYLALKKLQQIGSAHHDDGSWQEVPSKGDVGKEIENSDSEDDSEYEYPSSDEDQSDEDFGEVFNETLTEEQALLLALSNSRQEEIKRKQVNEKALQQSKEKEYQDLQLALHLSQQKEIERQQKEIERQQMEQDPKRIEKVYDEFVELLQRQFHQMQKQQDYDIWPAFFRLIVCYDYSMFLDNIIPSIASFWKLRDYEIDQKYGLSIVQPKIILLILDLRTRLIEFMKENYSSREDEELDIGEWPTSKVLLEHRQYKTHSALVWPSYLKPYEEKWNALFEQTEIRNHFKQQLFKESLFLIGTLYNFFKYTKEVNLIKYK
jgi:hypothetical protein